MLKFSVLKRLEDSHSSLLVQIFQSAVLPIFKLPIFYDYYPSWKNIFLEVYQALMQAWPQKRVKTVILIQFADIKIVRWKLSISS